MLLIYFSLIKIIISGNFLIIQAILPKNGTFLNFLIETQETKKTRLKPGSKSNFNQWRSKNVKKLTKWAGHDLY